MNYVNRFTVYQIGALVFVFVTSCNNVLSFGDLLQQSSTTGKEPGFAKLEEGQGLFDGIIKDEQTETYIQQISFFGHTSIGGIRQENNDIMTKLNLENIKRLEVIDKIYTSKRYPEKEFSLVRKISAPRGGAEVAEEILIPRNVVMCGIDRKTGDERSWYLNKIDQLIVVPASERGKSLFDDTTTTTTMPATTKDSVAKEQNKTEVAVTLSQEEKSQVSNEQEVEKASARPVAVMKQPQPHKEVIVVETTAGVDQPKTVLTAVTDFVKAFVDILKALFNFFKNLV